MKSKLFIISYNKKQADDYAISVGLKKNEYIYVSNTNVLRGMKEHISVIRIGDWYSRTDIYEILINLNILKAIEVKGFMVIKACKYLNFLNKDNAEKHLPENEVITWFQDEPQNDSHNESPTLIKYCRKKGILISFEFCASLKNAMCNDFEEYNFSVPVKPIIE